VTPKERVKNSIHFREVDKVPWQIDCTVDMAKRIMETHDLKEKSCNVLGKNIFQYNTLNDFFGNHLSYVRVEAVNSTDEIRPGVWIDEWGVLWDRSIDKDIGTPVNRLLEDMNLAKLKTPDPFAPERYEHFEPVIKANPDRYIIVKFSRCLFERAWSLRGMENLLIDLVENPGFVHELFEMITELNLQMIGRLADFSVEGVRFSDDWGSQRSLLMSPDTWREFIKPCVGRMYSEAHRLGYDVFIHTCGDITDILDDLVQIGVNVFNPFQPEAMNIEDIIERYSGRLAFHGGLSIQHTLPFGSPQQVRGEVKHRLYLARKHGGFIVAPSHDMPQDIPDDNLDAMLNVLRDQ
jgi:uroporphyrinogen decarboxylase